MSDSYWSGSSTWDNPQFGVDTSGIDFTGNPLGTGTVATGGGIGSVLTGIGQALGPIGRLAGAGYDIYNTSQLGPGQIFDNRYVKEATRELGQFSKKTRNQIRGVFEQIKGLTGVGTREAMDRYYDRWDKYMPKTEKRYLGYLREDPDISKQYEQLGSRMREIGGDWSLLGNEAYKAAYRAPDAVAPVNVNTIKDVMTLGPAYKQHYSYESPESKALIGGRPDAVAQYAAMFASSPDISTLMTYR